MNKPQCLLSDMTERRMAKIVSEASSSNNFWMKTPKFFNYTRELFTGCPLEVSTYKMCCLGYF